MPASLPSIFVIGSSATLLMHPHLVQLCQGQFHYSMKGQESQELAQALTNLDIPQGASAGDSGMVLKYLSQLQIQPDFKPDLTLLHVGMHDIKTNVATGQRQVSQPDFEQNALAIAQWFEAQNLRLVWMSAGPLDESIHNARQKTFHRYNADLTRINHFLSSISVAYNQPLIDLAGFTASLGPSDSLFVDHIHCHDAIVQQQAAFVVQQLRSILNP
jgi:hypothetical protein